MRSTFVTCICNHLRAFRADEEGAVTVDFIVLTSSVVLLSLAHVKDIADASNSIADNVSLCLSDDIANIMIDGNSEDYIANMQAAAAACASR